jgi:hypothetical protein
MKAGQIYMKLATTGFFLFLELVKESTHETSNGKDDKCWDYYNLGPGMPDCADSRKEEYIDYLPADCFSEEWHDKVWYVKVFDSFEEFMEAKDNDSEDLEIYKIMNKFRELEEKAMRGGA